MKWLPVVGLETLYEVSEFGDVRRADNRYKYNRPVKQVIAKAGYIKVTLSKNNKAITRYVHTIVAAAFIGERPEKYDINHKNGIKSDNSVANLEYITHAENLRHATDVLNVIKKTRARGDASGARTHPEKILRGEQSTQAKLTEKKVREIIRLINCGMKQTDVAKMIGISTSQVSKIKLRISWRHLSLD